MNKIKMISLFTIIGLSIASSAQAQGSSMSFKRYKNCEDCAYYIYADGRIDETTPLKFSEFLNEDDKGKTIFFNSLGGSLDGGIKLGELIRENKINTYLGNTYYNIDKYNKKEIINESPVCHSSCAYAFLGGVLRKTEKDSQYGIHNFRNRNSINNNYIQEKIVDMHIEDYLKKMGIDKDYLYLSKSYENEKIYIMPRNERKGLRVDNVFITEKSWNYENNSLVNMKNTKNGNVRIAIKRTTPGNYLLTYTYTLTNQSFIPNSVDDIFKTNTLFTLKLDRTSFILIAKDNWKKINKNSYEQSFNINKSILEQIYKAQQVNIIPQSNSLLIAEDVVLDNENIFNIEIFLKRNP